MNLQIIIFVIPTHTNFHISANCDHHFVHKKQNVLKFTVQNVLKVMATYNTYVELVKQMKYMMCTACLN